MAFNERTKKIAALGTAVLAGLIAGSMFTGQPEVTTPPAQRSSLSEIGEADITYSVTVGPNGYTVTGTIETGNKTVPYSVFVPRSLNGKATIRTN
jgi:hypothetical protein